MLVSVVIPAYNEEKYLAKTLDSVKGVKRPGFDLETIVVDGGSTDNTARIAAENGATVFKVGHGFIGAARQEGLARAKGEIVAITDADSVVPTNWLVEHLSVLQREDVTLTFGPYNVFENEGASLFSFYVNRGYAVIKLLPDFIKVLFASGQNIVFWRKKAKEIGGFDVRLRVMEDVDFVLRMRKKGKVVFLPDVVVLSSSRRSNEGLGFFVRGSRTAFNYFFLRKKEDLDIFPDYR